ncbi:MAG: acyl--CoA ligase [Candidatus Heimdallarchaeota archaeon]|nr:acyl--CoA ligase [Candidatus Heimdallarchaeota archaeon]
MASDSIPEFEYLWQYVDYWAEIDPDFPALRFNDQQISSFELKERSSKIADVLIHLGVERADRIVTILPAAPEYALLLIACNRIGAIIVPMDVRYRRADFIRLIPKIEPKLIISIVQDDKVSFSEILVKLKDAEKTLQNVKILFLGDSIHGQNYFGLEKIVPSRQEEQDRRMKEQSKTDDLIIVWTGGTTGFPKAAVLSNHNFVRMCIVENDVIKAGLSTRGIFGRIKYLSNLAVSHVGGSVELIGVGLIGGYELLIHNKWSSTKTLETIQKESLHVLLAAPTMYRIMMRHKDFDDFDLSSLKLVVISGEVVNQEFMDQMKTKFCKTIINGYGSTEMGPEVTFTHPDDDPATIAKGYVGKPLAGMKIKIIDTDANSLPTNNVGEILVQGDLVCKGYFRNPKENEKGFTSDGWIKTGDLGRLDGDGGLWLQGRIKDVIRVGTYSVLPMEIEELVLHHFSLDLAAAISIPDNIFGEVVWLVITPKAHVSISEDDILNLLQNELADYKIPKKIVFYKIDPDDPPITRIGKIDKNRLRKELLGR